MEKIDWVRKLTSRKFWAAICEFVAMLIVAMNGSQEQATKITALIMAGAAVIAFMIGEGLVDAAHAKGDAYILPDEEHPPEEE
jgi:hypothetical protein